MSHIHQLLCRLDHISHRAAMLEIPRSHYLINAVSYTHLDVYKRQPLMSAETKKALEALVIKQLY